MDTFSVEISTMKKTGWVRCILAGIILSIVGVGILAQSPVAASDKDRMPITTKSPEALADFEQGVVAWENLHITKALEHWQAAIEKDPDFLLAHLYISERIPDPDRQAAERKKALALMGSV